ncbi:MAG TPA: nuclear transport factor 2 family protein [Bryobacteraceae bacterium]|jgi:ketosteroid isomerase-like protein|nr:nuclear transport factor 2 family protein [Bryobacteraceae bacterium]
MTTRETLAHYFAALKEKSGWDAFLAEDLSFRSFTTPVRQINGKAAFLAATRPFYSMIGSFEVKDLLIDGERACALTHYDLQPPNRPAFTSDVAELFRVRDGRIVSFDIYFDTAPYPK